MEPHVATQQIKKFPWLKIIGFGFILYVAVNFLLFILSMVAGTEQPFSFWLTGVVVAVLMAVGSWRLSRWLHLTTARESLTYSIGWAAVNAALLLIVTIPNQTFGIVFGQWSTYLIFIGVAIGPTLGGKAASPGL
jgi:hypothetical protein